MAQKSDIEWTDATWNPVTGCTKVGPGCDNCYAERFAERWRGIPGHPYEQGFELTLWPSRLKQPVLWKKPRMIFVNSMSDLFHKDIDRTFLDAVFDAMEQADWHVYQVLTKRSSLMRNYVRKRYHEGPVPRHIWLGVSVEDAAHASRIEHLKQINSDARFISFEPLLGPVGDVDLQGVAWANPRERRGDVLMLTLDLTNAPRWHDLAPGVRVQLRPLTTALMVATRSDPAVEAVPEDASDEERAVAFAKALARRAVLAWEGIGDAEGNPIDPGPEAIDALLDVWPIFEAFQLTYVSKGLLLEQEKNASAPSPNGPSAGASATAKPAHPTRAASKPARTARRG